MTSVHIVLLLCSVLFILHVTVNASSSFLHNIYTVYAATRVLLMKPASRPAWDDLPRLGLVRTEHNLLVSRITSDCSD
jgi:hypothetical protein